MRLVALIFFAVTACDGGNKAAPLDLSVIQYDLLPPLSICGAPGDPGNSLGVGQFCWTADDCVHNSRATICSTIIDNQSNPQPDDVYFCTTTCTRDAGDAPQCGEASYCTCLKLGCGCVPSRCPLPDGGFQR